MLSKRCRRWSALRARGIHGSMRYRGGSSRVEGTGGVPKVAKVEGHPLVKGEARAKSIGRGAGDPGGAKRRSGGTNGAEHRSMRTPCRDRALSTLGWISRGWDPMACACRLAYLLRWESEKAADLDWSSRPRRVSAAYRPSPSEPRHVVDDPLQETTNTKGHNLHTVLQPWSFW